jgi:hypothetical protein
VRAGIAAETYTWLRYRTGSRSAERGLLEAEDVEARGVPEVKEPSIQREA